MSHQGGASISNDQEDLIRGLENGQQDGVSNADQEELERALQGLTSACTRELIQAVGMTSALTWVVILDLIFASGDSVCLTQDIQSYSIPFNLKTWLHLQASWVIIGYVLVMYISCKQGPSNLQLDACNVVTVVSFLSDIVMTLILFTGLVMFMGELYPAGTCGGALTFYMFVNLLLLITYYSFHSISNQIKRWVFGSSNDDRSNNNGGGGEAADSAAASYTPIKTYDSCQDNSEEANPV